MKKSSIINFADNKLKTQFKKLEYGTSTEKNLHYHITRVLRDIQQNAFAGIQIKKKLIPKEYIKKYDIKNLWKYNLPDNWRLLYSIEQEEIKIVALILDWLDHKNYDKKFNY